MKTDISSYKVPFLDLRVQDDRERKTILDSIEKVLLHGRLINGPEVDKLEHLIADYCGRKYALGVSSGTDALFLGLKVLGIGSGDEVITTSLSWIATANAIVLNGATPVFADIRNDLNIDPESVEKLITVRTKVILPVHYTGRICDMATLRRIAEKHGLLIVEDAAQSFGAEKYGKKAGSFGDVACFSMNAMKVYASCGEAGMVVCDNEEIREKLVMLRYGGMVNKEICVETSINGRLHTIQAAVLLERFNLISGIIRKRRKITVWYNDFLLDVVDTPVEGKDEFNVYYTYTIQADRRDELKEYLSFKGIETKVQHPILMPRQPIYDGRSACDTVRAEQIVKRVLCLPASEKITHEQVRFISGQIRRFYEK